MNFSAKGPVRIGAVAFAGWVLLTPVICGAKVSLGDKPDSGLHPTLAASAVPPAPPPPAEPTTLDPVVLRAIDELFADGLPDPRRGDYREIEIEEGPTWTDEKPLHRRHGF